MVFMGGLAVGGIAANSALSTYRYNRDGWMTDVQVDQARRYQRQNIRSMQTEMFRDDIRDLVGNAVSKQGNYVLMATLILGMIAECFVEGPLPEGTAEFVESAYMLCIGSSFLYLVMTLLCAVAASLLAMRCQHELLTTLVRLPAEEIVAEIEAAADSESTEAFESQGVAKMFRVPMLSGTTSGSGAGEMRTGGLTGMPDDWSSRQSSRSTSMAHTDSTGTLGENLVQGMCRSGTLDGIDASKKSSHLHLEVFHEREKEWESLSRFGSEFCVMGSSNLLQGYGYFAAAKFYEGDRWVSGVVQMLLVLVDSIFCRAMMESFPIIGLFRAALSIVGAIACMMAMRMDDLWIDRIGIPCCFFSHLLSNLIGVVHLYWITCSCPAEGTTRTFEGDEEESEAAPSTRRKSKGASSSQAARGSRAAKKEEPEPVGPEKSHRQKNPRRKLLLPLLGSSIVVLAWFATLVWAMLHAELGDGDDGVTPGRGLKDIDFKALTEAATPAVPVEVDEVAVAWPSSRFRPHALACADVRGVGTLETGAEPQRRCFAANDFMIIEILRSRNQTQEVSWTSTEVPCDIDTGKILDLVAACGDSSADDDSCQVQALVQDASGDTYSHTCMVARLDSSDSGDGSTSVATRRADLPELAKSHAKLQFVSVDGESMYVVDDRSKVLQYVRRSGRASTGGLPHFIPRWSVAEARRPMTDLAAIDVLPRRGAEGEGLGPTLLVLFYADGAVEAVDADSGVVCGAWSLEAAKQRPVDVAGGAVASAEGRVEVLVRAHHDKRMFDSVILLTAELPQVRTICAHKAATVAERGAAAAALAARSTEAAKAAGRGAATGHSGVPEAGPRRLRGSSGRDHRRQHRRQHRHSA